MVTSLWCSTFCICLFPTLLLCATVFHLLIVPVFLSLHFLLTSFLSPGPRVFLICSPWLYGLSSVFILLFSFLGLSLVARILDFGYQLIITVLSFYLPASLGVAFGCLFCDNMTPLLISNSVHFHGVVPRLRSVPMPWKHKKNPWEIDVVRLIVLISISGNPISGKMLMSTVRWFFVGLEGSLLGPTAFNSSKLS